MTGASSALVFVKADFHHPMQFVFHSASRRRSFFQLLAFSSAREGLPPSYARSLSSALGQRVPPALAGSRGRSRTQGSRSAGWPATAGLLPTRRRQHSGPAWPETSASPATGNRSYSDPAVAMTRTGIVAENVEPWPGSLATVRSPPISRQYCRLIASPRPVPPNCACVSRLAWL